MNNLEYLIDDVLIHKVLPEIPLYNLYKLCSTNKRFRHLCQNEQLWKIKVEYEFPNTLTKKLPSQTWQSYYLFLLEVKIAIPVPIFTSNKNIISQLAGAIGALPINNRREFLYLTQQNIIRIFKGTKFGINYPLRIDYNVLGTPVQINQTVISVTLNPPRFNEFNQIEQQPLTINWDYLLNYKQGTERLIDISGSTENPKEVFNAFVSVFTQYVNNNKI